MKEQTLPDMQYKIKSIKHHCKYSLNQISQIIIYLYA